MKTKINKKIFGITIAVVGVLLLSVMVVANVSFKKVVEVYPGETHIEEATLQNLAQDGPELEFQATIMNGEEIISIDDPKVKVKNGEMGEMLIEIKVPADATIGTVYKAKIIFRSNPVDPEAFESTGGNAIQFVTGVGMKFDIKVVEKPAEPATPQTTEGGSNVWLWVLAIAIIIVIVWIILKKKKK